MIEERWPESSVPLLGGWLVGDEPADCLRCSTAVLRPLTGHEEEWLAHHRGAPSAALASRVLDACVLRLDGGTPPHDLARRMLVGDRDYLILQLRRLMLGDRILAVVDCPACGAKMDMALDAAAIPVESRPLAGASLEVELPGRAGDTGRNIGFRLPTGADQEAILGMEIEAAADKLLERCLLDPGDVPLTAEEKAFVIRAMEEHAPRVEVELDLNCPECEHQFEAPFDTTTFFLNEMRISANQLLREVHMLALYYHWSESDILKLARDRRRSYLSLLSETLRQE